MGPPNASSWPACAPSSGMMRRPCHSSSFGKYIVKRESQPAKPPCTWRYGSGVSRHSSTSMYGAPKNGSVTSYEEVSMVVGSVTASPGV